MKLQVKGWKAKIFYQRISGGKVS